MAAKKGLYANINAKKKKGTSNPKSKSTISDKAYANMNARKAKGISRPKSKSTVSSKAYANMKEGFPKANKGMYVKKMKK